MRSSKKVIVLLGIALLVSGSLAYFYILPTAKVILADLETYKTRAADRNNYKLHTTPLPKSVVADICSKLDIQMISKSCQSGAVVYAPELFDEIKTYFRTLPDRDKTYNLVQDKLGLYLIECEQPDTAGDYRCRYDLRGDRIYPIFFYFDKEGFYWRIIANTGGS